MKRAVMILALIVSGCGDSKWSAICSCKTDEGKHGFMRGNGFLGTKTHCIPCENATDADEKMQCYGSKGKP